jgi:CDP-diacylglycerol--glycerol-3-phosphate 3-phosphatidyltransferase
MTCYFYFDNFRANLSNDYFSNRQDRYFMIKDSKDLCDFYCNLIDRVTEFSFRLQSDGSTIYSNKIHSHPFKSSSKKFTVEASNKIKKLFQVEMIKRLELKKEGISMLDFIVNFIEYNNII